MRAVCVCVVALVLLKPTEAPAAAGLSDILATQACWVRAPFALVKCQNEGGRYPARVVRARPTTADEESSWSLIPAGYDGIVPLDTVVDNVDRVSLAGRYLVAWQRSGRAVVVDLDAPAGGSVEFATLDAANEFLAGRDVSAVGEADFRSFESVYQEFGPQLSYWLLTVLAVGAALVCGAAFLWARRRSRRTRRCKGLAGIVVGDC